MTRGPTLTLPMLGSGMLHLGLLLLAAIFAGRPPPHEQRILVDYWSGDTLDVEAVLSPGAATPPAAMRPAADNQPAILPEPAAETAAQAQSQREVVHESAASQTQAEASSESRSAPLERVPNQPSSEAFVQQSPRQQESQASPPVPEPSAQAEVSPPTKASVAASATARAEPDSVVAPPAESAQAGDAGLTFGTPGPRLARNLARAFTRPIPEIFKSDPNWIKAKLGYFGSLTVRLEVDGEGVLIDAKPVPEDQKLRREFSELLRRLKGFLKMHRYQGADGPGEPFAEVLKVSITISQRAPSKDPYDDPGHHIGEGSELPNLSKPWRAWMYFVSGRFIEARVEFRRDLK